MDVEYDFYSCETHGSEHEITLDDIEEFVPYMPHAYSTVSIGTDSTCDFNGCNFNLLEVYLDSLMVSGNSMTVSGSSNIECGRMGVEIIFQNGTSQFRQSATGGISSYTTTFTGLANGTYTLRFMAGDYPLTPDSSNHVEKRVRSFTINYTPPPPTPRPLRLPRLRVRLLLLPATARQSLTST